MDHMITCYGGERVALTFNIHADVLKSVITVIRTVLIEHNLGFHFLVSAHFYLVNKHNFAVLSIFDRYELIILNCISE